MVVGKKRITIKGLLELIAAGADELFPLTRAGAYRRFYRPKYIDWEDFFPSVVEKKINSLQRLGFVVKKETPEGWVVTITEKGKKRVLEYKLGDLEPKAGSWDGKWRLVFFDIVELSRGKRDRLRKYLKKLGLKPMQESVYVGPFDIKDEVAYVREVLDIPDGVKLGVMEELENDEDLREIFKVG